MAMYGPREDGVIIRLFHDLFLEAQEGFLSLTVEQWHVDVENSQQTIGSVFDACCDSFRRPGHPLGNWTPIQRLSFEDCLIYAGVKSQEVAQWLFRAQMLPQLIIEDDVFRSKEFLQSPTTGKPDAWFDLLFDYITAGSMGMNIGKKGVTDGGSFIPPIHWIDGFAELGAACLVDATSIHPHIIQTIIHSVLAWFLNFGKALHLGCHC